jgi:trehalose utilization protein
MSWVEGGEGFRSGCTRQRGFGRMFYFRPGHEAFPSFYNEHVLHVLANGIRWLKPTVNMPYPKTNVPDSLEPISPKDFTFHKVGIVKP